MISIQIAQHRRHLRCVLAVMTLFATMACGDGSDDNPSEPTDAGAIDGSSPNPDGGVERDAGSQTDAGTGSEEFEAMPGQVTQLGGGIAIEMPADAPSDVRVIAQDITAPTAFPPNRSSARSPFSFNVTAGTAPETAALRVIVIGDLEGLDVLYFEDSSNTWLSIEFTFGTDGAVVITNPQAGIYAVTRRTSEQVSTETFDEVNPSTGDWELTDQGPQGGAFAIRAPMLPASGVASYSFSCAERSHTEFSFYWRGQLSLLVDGILFEDLPQANGWRQRRIVLPGGDHTYTFEVRTAGAPGQPNAFVDTLVCSNTTPTPVPAPNWGFDRGFVPDAFGGVDGGQVSWQIVNDTSQAGSFSIRPPVVPANQSASFEFSCGGRRHTEMSFYWVGSFDLYVDGRLFETMPFRNPTGWTLRKISVPQGVHTYRFQVSSTETRRPFAAVDTVECRDLTPTDLPQNEEVWGFDDGFVPTETVGLDGAPPVWEITNGDNQAGGSAVRAPIVPANQSAFFEFRCGGRSHTEFSFYWVGSFDLYVDGRLFETMPFRNPTGWTQRSVVLPSGTHTYRFEVSTTETARPFAAVDTFRCRNVTEEPNAPNDEFWEFDDGFVPTEIAGLDGTPPVWELTNGDNQTGGYAIRAPIVPANQSASFEFSCGSRTHTEFSFYWVGSFNLYVDGRLFETMPFRNPTGWTRRRIVVPQGTHTYRFEVSSTQTQRVFAAVDTFSCRNNPPTDNAIDVWGFDDGFIPTEASGLDSAPPVWEITDGDNQAGGYAVRAPILPANQSASFEFSCRGDAHTEFSFYWVGSFDLYVDGRLFETMPFRNPTGWTQRRIVLPLGMHTYRFEVATANAQRVFAAVDTFACGDTMPVGNTTNIWTFDRGFVPTEFTGFADMPPWEITNDRAQAGAFSARIPVIPANETAAVEFSCGGVSHSQLTFYYTGSVEFYIDNALSEVLPFTNGWVFRDVSVSSGQHTYRWQKSSTTGLRESGGLDTVTCTP